MKHFLFALWLAGLPAFGAELNLDFGKRSLLEPHFSGYGWSLSEARAGRGFAWISRREADVAFPWEAAEPLRVSVLAAPHFQTGKRQVVGVFINGTFAGQYTFPESPAPQEFSVDLPAEHVRVGANTLTFRLGYLARTPDPKRDQRKLGLQVRQIRLRSWSPP
jgi:hypothetical protein